MQGQDLSGVMASAALRSTNRVADVVEAMNTNKLVRGYPMRGTIFLAAAADLRWITELCARQSLRDAYRRREQRHGITETDVRRVAQRVQEQGIDTGMSRKEFMEAVAAEGIDPASGRGYHMLFTLIAEGMLCYGHWNGTDQQIMLASEVLGPGLEARFNGDSIAATAQLAARYFRTRGPATVRDFVWWCKLPLKQIRAALLYLPGDVELVGDETYARAGLAEQIVVLGRAVAKPLLLPGFDEYILGYPDRLFAMDSATHEALVPGNNGVFKKSIVVDGVVRGCWARTGPAGRREIQVTQLGRIPKSAHAGVRRRFAEYPFIRV